MLFDIAILSKKFAGLEISKDLWLAAEHNNGVNPVIGFKTRYGWSRNSWLTYPALVDGGPAGSGS